MGKAADERGFRDLRRLEDFSTVPSFNRDGHGFRLIYSQKFFQLSGCDKVSKRTIPIEWIKHGLGFGAIRQCPALTERCQICNKGVQVRPDLVVYWLLIGQSRKQFCPCHILYGVDFAQLKEHCDDLTF